MPITDRLMVADADTEPAHHQCVWTGGQRHIRYVRPVRKSDAAARQEAKTDDQH